MKLSAALTFAYHVAKRLEIEFSFEFFFFSFVYLFVYFINLFTFFFLFSNYICLLYVAYVSPHLALIYTA